MRHVQRDPFDCSADEWLAARDALIELFSVQETVQETVPETANEAVNETAAQATQRPLSPEAPCHSEANAASAISGTDSLHSDQEKALARTLGQTASEHLALQQLPDDFKLSVIVPVFNEASTIEQVLHRVFELPIPLEVLIIDDGSRDGSRELLGQLIPEFTKHLPPNKAMHLILHDGNLGKGAALKTGFLKATGSVIAIQDADLEYDPMDFLWLLGPLLTGKADVVYGSRFGRGSLADSPFWHRWGNQLITICSDLTTGLFWSDVETCYKMVRTPIIKAIAPTLKERGFGIELELTAKLARHPGLTYFERPIRYQKRGYAEGKKIGMKDALWAAWCITRYRLAN
jgi:hypothetical protein